MGQIPAKAESTRTRKVGSWRSSGTVTVGEAGGTTRVAMSAAMAAAGAKHRTRGYPEVNRVLYVELPFNITADEMYDIFGKYGAIIQIRLACKGHEGHRPHVVYEDIHDAAGGGPPQRVQRGESIPHRAVLQPRQDEQEGGPGEEGGPVMKFCRSETLRGSRSRATPLSRTRRRGALGTGRGRTELCRPPPSPGDGIARRPLWSVVGDERV